MRNLAVGTSTMVALAVRTLAVETSTMSALVLAGVGRDGVFLLFKGTKRAFHNGFAIAREAGTLEPIFLLPARGVTATMS